MAQSFIFQAAYDFEAENEAELTLKEGDIVEVFNTEGEWWEGALPNGKVGLFPANRVVPYYANETETAGTGEQYYAATGAGEQGYYEQQQYDQAAYSAAQPAYGHQYDQHPVAGLQANGLYMSAVQDQKYQADMSASRKPYGNGGIHAASSSHLLAPAAAAGPAQVELEMKRAADSNAAKKGGSGGGDKAGGGGGKGGDKAGGGGDARGPRKPTSKTKIGVWASNQAVLTCILLPILGIGATVWGIKDSDKYGLTYVICGIYCMCIGPLVVIWERVWGYTRGPDKMPFRGVVYLGLSIFCFFSIPTLFGGTWLVGVGVTNIVSAYIGEQYEAPKDEPESEPEKKAASNKDCWGRILEYINIKRQQNELGSLVFLSLYVASNIIIFAYFVSVWEKKNADFPPAQRLSGWAPFAKGFGNMLNWNCSIIVVPVLRTIIRWLYNVSTANEGCIARIMRAVLKMVPLDHALTFHKIIAVAIVIGTLGHIIMHVFNYINAPGPSWDKFGVWPWITGGVLCEVMILMYSAAMENVKRPHFEVFWYSHHLFIIFFWMLLNHGAGFVGPNYWKWFLGPGILYVIERLLRFYRASQDVVLLSCTFMKPDVFSLEFAKEGVFKHEYKEGMYIFIQCPHLSKIQWHPFTISSAPQEKTVTLHIKVMDEGSWTRELQKYFMAMGPRGATYYEHTRQTAAGLVPGKIMGPDGLRLLCIDGPHSAPTQHVSEYHTVMVAGAGIGVTPVAATLKSVVLHRWKYYMGHCFPDNAYFFWVCSHKDIDSFRWLIRAIKDCEDEVFDMRAKNAKDMSQKRFEVHMFISSVPKDQQPIDVVVDDEIGFWGVPREDRNLDKVRAPFDELDLYKAMKCPPKHLQLGDVHIWSGRPVWDDRFQAVTNSHPKGDIGVTFCGNPMIGQDLKKMCFKYSSLQDKRIFKLHMENF